MLIWIYGHAYRPESICHQHQNQHAAWGELFENNGLQINIQGVDHIMATNYGSPPVPPPCKINSRPDMFKVRPERPCAIPMHGADSGSRLQRRRLCNAHGANKPHEPTCPSEATHPSEPTCPAESTSPVPPAIATTSAYVTAVTSTPATHVTPRDSHRNAIHRKRRRCTLTRRTDRNTGPAQPAR
ncbi:hypothetical protein DAPPUDRAFT_245997 [Daphnia pulex]|uniref:Uncharacterized protein n=1 Tax=Daphnia pulex TaxID=6669 RepID=E9GPF6_DAPPU|nr:hypothetical protein DAPPUDRAFT_245997 [Daphnia pulex]|eukprot:EFX78690.1 hypothetical protein DAPPUDRAFT_245997 [Daphnia pulex]